MPFQSQQVQKPFPVLKKKVPLATKKLTLALFGATLAATVLLSGCGGSSSSSGNSAPIIGNSNIGYTTPEETTKTVTFETILTDAEVSDPDGDAITLKVEKNDYQNEIEVDSTAKTVTFTAPSVDDSQGFEIYLKAEDSNGASRPASIKVTFVCTDAADDSPLTFNVSDLEAPTSILTGADYKFTASPTDDNGIESLTYTLIDPNGSVLDQDVSISEGQVETISELADGEGYTLTVTATGVDGGEGDNSGPISQSVEFNVTSDAPVEITSISLPESVIQGDPITGTFSVPQTADGVTYVGYKVALDDGSPLIDKTELGTDAGDFTVPSYDTSSLNTGDIVNVTLFAEDNGATSSSNTTVTRSINIDDVDTIPNAFSFTDVTNAEFDTVLISETLTLSGTNKPASISVTGGSYQINGGPFIDTDGTINPGDTFALQQTSASDYSQSTDTTLTIGGVSDTWTVTTKAASNTAPTAKDITIDYSGFISEITYDMAPDIHDDETADSGLTITVVTNPTEGTLEWNGTEFTYSSSMFSDSDSFTYKVTDAGGLDSDIKTVTLDRGN